jgi:hypothetical protein
MHCVHALADSKSNKEKKTEIFFTGIRGNALIAWRKSTKVNINLVLGFANYYKGLHRYFAFTNRLFTWPKTGLEIVKEIVMNLSNGTETDERLMPFLNFIHQLFIIVSSFF